jgi:D-methionine transport system ATP-binding protein
LLSDEATSALDPETTHAILALLRNINRQTGITVVMVTHQMEVVREICDRVAVLSHGQVVEIGRTAEIFAFPHHEVTRAMVSAAMASELSDATLQAMVTRMQQEGQQRPDIASRLLRLSWGAGHTAGALISDLSRRFSLDIHLIQARIEDVQGVAVGTIFVLIQGAVKPLQLALDDLSQRNIIVKELAHEPTSDRSSSLVAS